MITSILCLALGDAGTKRPVVPELRVAFTIVFSSPSVKNYQHFAKESSPIHLYTPNWSYRELLEAKPTHLYTEKLESI